MSRRAASGGRIITTLTTHQMVAVQPMALHGNGQHRPDEMSAKRS
jgi:hypothetical protein